MSMNLHDPHDMGPALPRGLAEPKGMRSVYPSTMVALPDLKPDLTLGRLEVDPFGSHTLLQRVEALELEVARLRRLVGG